MWPYDELAVSQGRSSSEFLIQTPWLSVTVNPAAEDLARVAAIATKIQTGALGADDRFELTWLLKPLTALPLAYFLPRPAEELLGPDHHSVLKPVATNLGPERVWTWDLDATLQFCQTPQGYDPLSLLSVARRFHLIDLLQGNPLAEAMALIRTFPANSERHRQATAIIVRQNHYVTSRCDSSLAPAVAIAQSAASAVSEFINAEKGHDKLLEKALRSLVADPQTVPVLPATAMLMDLLQLSASRNLLGFALAVDIFERASYSEKDPLAAFLADGGYDRAAKQIDVHKKINDSGDHENVSLGLLAQMAAVDRDYATEALRLAEAVSQAVLGVSSQILNAVTGLA